MADRGSPARRRIQDRVRCNLTSIGPHSLNAASARSDARNLRIGMNFDLHALACARVPPDHRVMSDPASRRMKQSRENREPRPAAQVEYRDQLSDLVRIDQTAIHA